MTDNEHSSQERYPLMTLEMARGYLARAVLTQGPDFVYRATGRAVICHYKALPDSTPETDPRHHTGCMVGVVMKLSGREILEVHEGETPESVYMREEWNLSARAGRYLYSAQYAQDNGHTWGQAYAHAEDMILRISEDGSVTDGMALCQLDDILYS